MGQLVEEQAERRARSWRADLPVAATAAVLSGLGWAAARLVGADLVVNAGSRAQHVDVVSVVATAVGVAMVGGYLLRALERHTVRGRRTWTWVAVGVLAVSLLLGPATARTVADGLVLAGLHLLVGAIVIAGAHRRSDVVA